MVFCVRDGCEEDLLQALVEGKALRGTGSPCQQQPEVAGQPAACHTALTPPGGDTGTVGATTATSVPGARVKSASTGQVGTRGLLG